MQRTLLEDWRQCNWLGMKDRCGSHTVHDWSTTRQQNADFKVSVAEGADQRDMNGKTLNFVPTFPESIDLSLRKAAGDATFKWVSDLVDLGFQFSLRFRQLLAPQMYLIVSRLPPSRTLSSPASFLLSQAPRPYYCSRGVLLSLLTPARSALALPNYRTRRSANGCLRARSSD
jgi:hypothetical protein